MGVVLLNILQWILRIVLFLLLFVFVLVMVVLVVPVRYQAEGEFIEKVPGIRGKVTWFFYLFYMSFVYEEDFLIQVRLFGFKIFDSAGSGMQKSGRKSSRGMIDDSDDSLDEVYEIGGASEDNLNEKYETRASSEDSLNERCETQKISEDNLNERCETREISETLSDKMTETQAVDADSKVNNDESVYKKEIKQTDGVVAEGEKYNFQEAMAEQEATDSETGKVKKSFAEKIESMKLKIQDIIQKVKDIFTKIKEGKLKAEHYLELWNRKETQVTFHRAKKKLWKMVKAILPGKWIVAGEIGFDNPCTTGQMMGILGALYPVFGNKIQIVPDFESEVMNIRAEVKGHIRLGNLLYQLVSLLLNKYCIKFIKLIFDELSSSKKSKKET